MLSRKLKLGDTTFSIVGVAAPEFFGTNVGQAPDIWVPMSMLTQVPPHWKGYSDNRAASLLVMGRLKPGVTFEQATANANVLFHQIWLSYRNEHTDQRDLTTLEKTHLILTPMATGLSNIRGQFSDPLKMLMALVAIVLLIACANIANLLLARSTARAREFAVRQALGAKRTRLVRQLLTESLMLAMAGGALGIALAAGANHILLRMVSAGQNALLPIDVSINSRLLLFTFGVTMLTALLFGTLPALRATRLELTDALKDGRGAQNGTTKSPLAKALVISQVAFSLVLLVGAGLFTRSLINLNTIDAGFNKENALLFDTDASSVGYKEDEPRLTALYQQIEDRVRAVHGVSAASFSSFTFHEGSWNSSITVPGIDTVSSGDVKHDVVGNEYFKAMQIPLVAGRTFGPQDTETSQKVAVISEYLAKTRFPNVNPIGRHYHIGGADSPWDLEVIGIVKDVKFESLSESIQTLDYIYYPQRRQYMKDLVVRYNGDSAAVSAAVQQAIHSIDRNLPITRVTTLDEQVADSIIEQRTVARLCTFFGLLAVFLSCIGIYGLMSYVVSRRTNLRLAFVWLSAPSGSTVRWLVMREIMLLIGVGVAIGIPATLASGRLITKMLYGLKETDPASLIASVVALLAVGMLAGYLPARRASRVDPSLVALRYE